MNARADLPLGVFHGLPFEQYHASAGISHTGLRDFARSPLHYHALHLNPLRPPAETKAGQLEGSLAHCAILEPAELLNRYALGPCEDRRLKAWKDWEERIDSRTQPIKPSQWATCQAQACSVRTLPDVAQLLGAGKAEVSAFWIDPSTGEICRCRPDWVHPVSARAVILVDVKTYSDASPREFERQVARKAYHRQAAWYSDGYALASGLQVLGFVFVAVETSWPFAASAVMLDDEWLDKGRNENRELLDRYVQCRAANNWPGHGPSIELIALPKWMTY